MRRLLRGVRFDTSSKKGRAVPFQAKQKRIQQVPCRNCNLVTPAWRELCVHCGDPLPDVGAEEAQDERAR